MLLDKTFTVEEGTGVVLDALARMRCMDRRVYVSRLLSISEARPPSSTVVPLQCASSPRGGAHYGGASLEKPARHKGELAPSRWFMEVA